MFQALPMLRIIAAQTMDVTQVVGNDHMETNTRDAAAGVW